MRYSKNSNLKRRMIVSNPVKINKIVSPSVAKQTTNNNVNIDKCATEQVLNDDMVSKVFKNKFPYINAKKFMRFILDHEDEAYDIFKGRGFGLCTITNPGLMRMNKDGWKHKIIESYGAANPGVGMGAMYILTGAMIKGIDKMRIGMAYGVQHLTEHVAQEFMDKLQAKLELIGSSNTNYKSKL